MEDANTFPSFYAYTSTGEIVASIIGAEHVPRIGETLCIRPKSQTDPKRYKIIDIQWELILQFDDYVEVDFDYVRIIVEEIK